MAINPGTRYPGKTDADPAYPYGKARNAVTFQDGTGTPFERDWLNDLWGFEQALLGAAGLTPSGTPDQVGASQYLDAVNAIATAKGAAAEAAAKAYADTVADRAGLVLRQVTMPSAFDSGTPMAAIGGLTTPQIIAIKVDTRLLAESDDITSNGGSPAFSVNAVARNGARLVAVGAGGGCAFSTNEGTSWTAGSALGAESDAGGLIYVPTHSRFMATFSAGTNVAQDADGASVWTNVACGLSTAQGGIAAFSTGDVVVGGLDGASAVAMARSTNGGGSWAATTTVPNPSQYGDAGNLVGNGGTLIFHVGRANANSELRICAATSGMLWTLRATLTPPSAITAKPRILLCPDTGALVVVATIAGGLITVAYLSRDQGLTWSAPTFYRVRDRSSFAIARGRLLSTIGTELYASDKLI